MNPLIQKITLLSLILLLTTAGESNAGDLIFKNGFEQLTTSINAGPDQNVLSGAQVLLTAQVLPGSETPVSVQWVQVGGDISVDIANPDSLSATFIAPWTNPNNRLYKFKITASYASQEPEFDEVIIMVTNSGPLANGGPDLLVLAGANVVLDGSASQLSNGGIPTSFLWEVVDSAGNTINLNNANSSSANFTAPMVSETQLLKFRLSVFEGALSHSTVVNVTVVLDLTFKDFGGNFRGIDVNETQQIAYLAQGEGGLGIYDIADKTNPQLIGTYNTTGNAFGVLVKNNIAYVADQYNGLVMLDVSTPSSPVLISLYNTPNQARAV
ncbi:MAG TPA: hypothetical protein ENJ41_00825, partial [Oceanospirillales bacterium]|nr:hypothetical protein [Oceanospirillales bacterium]